MIRYPGRDKWTELFDLAADPYEIKNLYDDRARADLRERMEAEFEKQTQAVSFVLPERAVPPPEGTTPPTKKPMKKPMKKNKKGANGS